LVLRNFIKNSSDDPQIDVGEVVLAPFPHQSVSSPVDVPWREASFCPPSTQLHRLLHEVYAREPPATNKIEDLDFQEGLWWIWDQVFVPLGLRSRVLKDFHDEPTSGHPGSLKTLDLLTCTMTWPGVRKDVISYVKSCFSCQRAKHSNQQLPGLMNPLPIPPRPWSVIGIDSIVKLPVLGALIWSWSLLTI
jgi:hypothetical protein